jgi:hypothetical protein
VGFYGSIGVNVVSYISVAINGNVKWQCYSRIAGGNVSS